MNKKISINNNLITDYHAKYYAYSMTRTGGKGLDRISRSLFDASVDLNPHQVEAALFALRSPLSQGVILADEVGLGKTIEAGLVLSQYWAERKRKLIIVCPAALRKQWQIELQEKFYLPSVIMDSKKFREILNDGELHPFEQESVIIISYHYASGMADLLKTVQWDLVVMDEAHKLRNSYRSSNRIGQNIRWIFEDRKKILLTATPLQNSLIELYGLSTIIDEQLFGDLPTFRTLYTGTDGDIDDLRARLKGFCKRTLRSEVLEFIRYTERKLTTIRFKATDEEHKLYEAVSSFLQRPDTYSIPARQKHLTVIVVRKVLASSHIALAGTLEVIKNRLVSLRDNAVDTTDITERILQQDDLDEDLIEELLEEIEHEDVAHDDDIAEDEAVIDKKKLEDEILEVDQYIRWARSIGIDTKTRHLLKALTIGYQKMSEMGALEKAVIFTESRRTQEYLKNFLEANGYAGQVVTFSGVNRDPKSAEIYDRWVEKNRNSETATGSRAVDLRHAIIDYFQKEAKIMIATEAAAEGINLQFCSLLINYDLPWNPQRIEQRIGRVHRYGQKHDVVVINFLNERNAADRRVYDLLQYKFNLFEGVFGVSDDVLGRIDNAAGFEARIIDLYQQCRTEDEIEEAFKKLQEELDQQIRFKLIETRKKLLENFDEDVHNLLKIDYDEALYSLDAIGKKFWRLSKHIMHDIAEFDDENLTFKLHHSPNPDIPQGIYRLQSKKLKDEAAGNDDQYFIYRLSHPLGEYCIDSARNLEIPVYEVSFNLTDYESKISVIEKLNGQNGWLILTHLSINCLEEEEYLLFSGFTDRGDSIDADVLEQFFRLSGETGDIVEPDTAVITNLNANASRYVEATKFKSLESNNIYFQEKREQLYRWSEDVVAAAERDLKQAKAELRAAERDASLAVTMEEQKLAQEKIAELQKKKRAARNNIFKTEDDIEVKREQLIQALERRMVQDVKTETLFILRWKIV
ncbi:MAG TPA: SNF2-related protein [Bacteroidales bacterium]|nr:SNF2-related protein [Bacteroidales bacterium]